MYYAFLIAISSLSDAKIIKQNVNAMMSCYKKTKIAYIFPAARIIYKVCMPRDTPCAACRQFAISEKNFMRTSRTSSSV